MYRGIIWYIFFNAFYSIEWPFEVRIRLHCHLQPPIMPYNSQTHLSTHKILSKSVQLFRSSVTNYKNMIDRIHTQKIIIYLL